VQWRQDADRRIMALATAYVKNYRQRKDESSHSEADDDVVLRNCVERVVEDIELEAHLVKCLCHKVQSQSPPLSHAAWVSVVATLCLNMSKLGKQLKSSNGGVNEAGVNLSDAIRKSVQKDGITGSSKPSGLGNGQTLSGWIVESWTEQSMQLGSNMEKYAPNPQQQASDAKRSPRADGPKAILVKGLDKSICDKLQLGQWDFDALTIAKEHENIVEIVGFELLRQFVFLSRQPLQGFLRAVESMYQKNNPYHTNVHAADMTNSFLFVFRKSNFWASCDLPDAMSAATILAGLAHDVGHPGRNNQFMISTRNCLAITYNDRSVLENFHAASLIRLLDESYGSHESGERSNLLAALPSNVVTNMRSLMTTLILKTDTQKHLEDLAAFRLRLGAEEFAPVSDLNDQQQAMCIIFRAADIGHSAKPWAMHEEWSKRVVREFHAQGDEEKRLGLKVSPLCEREGFVLATAQCGFLQFICLPTWRELARFEKILLKKAAGEDLDADFQAVRSERVSVKDKGFGLFLKQASCQGFDKAAVPSDPTASGMSQQFTRRNSLPSDGNLTRHKKPTMGGRLKRPQSKQQVAPLTRSPWESTNASAFSGFSRERRSSVPQKYIAEVCLSQCERNFQAWKNQAEANKNNQAEPTMPVKHKRSDSECDVSTSVTDVEAA